MSDSDSAEAVLRRKAMESMFKKKSDVETRLAETEAKRHADLDDKEDGEIEDETPIVSTTAVCIPAPTARADVSSSVISLKPRTVNLSRVARTDGGLSDTSKTASKPEEKIQQVHSS